MVLRHEGSVVFFSGYAVWNLCESIWLIFRHVIKAKFLHPKDLHPGMMVSCEIKEHIHGGAFVIIDGGRKSLTGFVRTLHLGSVPLQHPEKKFPVGSCHSARVRT
jgi:ribosomal protein S1